MPHGDDITFHKAIPHLPTLSMEKSLAYYREKFGFEEIDGSSGYGVTLRKGQVLLQLWECDDPEIPRNSGCRFEVSNIQDLYAQCEKNCVIHPRGRLSSRPDGGQEFTVLDLDGNLLTFFDPAAP